MRIAGLRERSDSVAAENSPPVRVAYLASRYPAPSHSFILREVEALRRIGAEIHTFAIHPPEVLTRVDREAAGETLTLFPLRWRAYAAAHVRAFGSRPRAYVRTLGLALRLPRAPGAKRRSKLFYFAGAVRVWDECARRGLRHLHAHFTTPAADTAQLVGELGGRSWSWSFTAHGTDIFEDAPARLAEKVRRAALVVCVSDFGRSRLMTLVEEEHWPKIELVRCGLDARWLAGDPRPPRPAQALRVLCVGRLEREKGQSILLEALAELKRRDVPVELELVGVGSRLNTLRRMAGELGIADRVRFAGAVGQDSIRERFLDADVFCLPSLGEGVPVVLMEAMACGRPVVASGIMGIPELVEDRVSGLLVAPGRPGELADALEALARDPLLRSRMGAAGRARVADAFRVDASAERLVDLLRACRGAAGTMVAVSSAIDPGELVTQGLR